MKEKQKIDMVLEELRGIREILNLIVDKVNFLDDVYKREVERLDILSDKLERMESKNGIFTRLKWFLARRSLAGGM